MNLNTTLTPPGPPGHWLTGNVREFRKGRLEFLVRSARTYGDVVALRIHQFEDYRLTC